MTLWFHWNCLLIVLFALCACALRVLRIPFHLIILIREQLQLKLQAKWVFVSFYAYRRCKYSSDEQNVILNWIESTTKNQKEATLCQKIKSINLELRAKHAPKSICEQRDCTLVVFIYRPNAQHTHTARRVCVCVCIVLDDVHLN